MVVILKPDHVRDVDLVVRRYGARAFGPWLFWRTNIPETELEPIEPGSELPGGLVALYDGRGRNETPLWLPEQRALVFADALTAPGGELRVWATPALEERALPALRALLELPFEHVIVAHGEPVHDRAEYERALARPPWTGEDSGLARPALDDQEPRDAVAEVDVAVAALTRDERRAVAGRRARARDRRRTRSAPCPRSRA